MAITITNVTPSANVAPGQKISITGTELDTVDFFTVGGKVAQVAAIPARTATAATLVLAPDTPTGATAVSAYKGNLAPVQSGAVAIVTPTNVNSDYTSTLARKWRCDVQDPAAGLAWTQIRLIKNFTPLIDPAFADDPTYDDDGGQNQGKVGVDNKLTMVVSRKRSRVTGLYDRGQEILRSTLLAFGGLEVVTVRWYDRSGGSSDAFQNNFDVKWGEAGGNDRDIDTVSVELMGKGIPQSIQNPAG